MSKYDKEIYKDKSWNSNLLKNAFNISNMVTIKKALTEIVPGFINEELKQSNTLYSNKLKIYNDQFKSKLYEFKKEICDTINNCEEMKKILKEKLTPEKKEIFSPFFTKKIFDYSENHNTIYVKKKSSDEFCRDEVYYDELDGDFQCIGINFGGSSFYRYTEVLLTSKLAVYGSIFKKISFQTERYSDILFGLDKNNKFTIKRRIGNSDYPLKNRATSEIVYLNSDIPEDMVFSDEAFNGLLRDVSNNKKLDKLYHELVDFSKIFDSIVDEYEKNIKSIVEKYCNVMIKLDNGKYIKFEYKTCVNEDVYKENGGHSYEPPYRELKKIQPYVEVFYGGESDDTSIERGISLNYYVVSDYNVGLSVYDEDLKEIDSFDKNIYYSDLDCDAFTASKRLLNYFVDSDSLEVFNPFNPSREKQIIEIEKEMRLLEKEVTEKERLRKQKEMYYEKVKHSEEIFEKNQKEIEQAKEDLVGSLKKLKEFNKVKKVQVPFDQVFYYDDNKKCYEVNSEFRDLLDVIDMALFDFENVNVSGIDFRGCNPLLLDPQKVYNKDLSGTRFDISESEYEKKGGDVYYIPSLFWDLDGVDLENSNLYVPTDYVESNAFSMPINIDKAITNDKTVLPDVWKDELKKDNNSYDDLVVEELLLQLIKNGEKLNLVSKEEASILENYYIKENEENKGGKTR